MALMKLAHFAALHLGSARLRKRTDRQLRPVRPSRKDELHYRAELRRIVNHLRTAGLDLAEELRPHWPAVHDETAPGLPRALDRLAAKFGNIEGVAKRLTDVADRLSVVRRNLASVDERLGKAVQASVGIDISPLLHNHGDIATEMAKAASANVDLIKSIPAQYLDQVREAVTGAWSDGLRWESLIAKIQHIGDVTDSRARLIARDQTSKMNAAFNEVRQMGLGIERYTWSGVKDARERKSHLRMEGTAQRWDAPPDVDGERVHPGEAINCRCVALPRFDLDEVARGGARQEAQAA